MVFMVISLKSEPRASSGAKGITFSGECRSMFTVGTWLSTVDLIGGEKCHDTGQLRMAQVLVTITC